MNDLDHERFESRVDRRKTAGLFLLGILMTAASYFCTTLGRIDGIIAGYLGLLFFGLCTAVIFWELLRAKSRIVIDQNGIFDFRFGAGCIPWEEIEALEVVSIQSQKMLGVKVSDPEIYLQDMSPLRRFFASKNGWLGFDAITLSFTGLTPGIDEAIEAVENLRPDLPIL